MQHHIVMRAAKAGFVCFHADIVLHHGGAENGIDLIVLQAVIQRTQRTPACPVLRRCLKGFIYRDRI